MGTPSPAGRASARAVGWWLIACAALVYAMVVVGGVTRLTGSGLSMVRWHPIHGVVPPIGEDAWRRELDAYRASPEYRLVNRGMSLAEFKRIFWMEYAHRMLGRGVGIAFLAPFLVFLAMRAIPREMIPRLAGVFVLGGAQGVLGWYMVRSGLVDEPRVSQYRLAAHLSLAVVIYVYLLALALRMLDAGGATRRTAGCAEIDIDADADAGVDTRFDTGADSGARIAGRRIAKADDHGRRHAGAGDGARTAGRRIVEADDHGWRHAGADSGVRTAGRRIAEADDHGWRHAGADSGVRTAGRRIVEADDHGRRHAGAGNGARTAGWLALAAGGCVFVTLVMGAFVAGLKAGYVYPTFPKMGGFWAPPGMFDASPWWRNLFENPVAAQFAHRVLALASALAVVAAWGASLGAGVPRRVRLWAHASLAAVAVQLALGVSTLLLHVPIPLAAGHQAGAVALLTCLVGLYLGARASRPVPT